MAAVYGALVVCFLWMQPAADQPHDSGGDRSAAPPSADEPPLGEAPRFEPPQAAPLQPDAPINDVNPFGDDAPPVVDVPPARIDVPPAADVPPAVAVPTGEPPQHFAATPAGLLLEAMGYPDRDGLTGQPLTLVGVLSHVDTRDAQTNAAAAYWSLAAAVARYHQCQLDRELLAHVDTGEAFAVAGSAEALTAADDALAAAGREVIDAQRELAAQLQMAPDEPPPLPYDVPFTGAYRTGFATVFAGQAPPPQAILIDRVLPMRQAAIEARSRAVQAADDALAAAIEPRDGAAADAAGVIAQLAARAEQQRAFLDAVEMYNREIAAYALGVASPNLTVDRLAAMLAKPRTVVEQEQTQFVTTADRPATGGVEQAGHEAPVDDSSSAPLPAVAADVAAPPASPEADFAARFTRLRDMPAPRRAQHLAAALHTLDDEAGQPLALAEYLGLPTPAERSERIAAYWRTAAAAARRGAYADRVEQLRALAPVALDLSGATVDAQAMLELQAARAAAEADLRDAEIGLATAQYELTVAGGQPLQGSPWLLPSTPPHGGRYRLNLDTQPDEIANDPAVREAAERVATLVPVVQERATAVVQADTARAAASEEFASGRAPLSQVLASVAAQTAATLDMLAVLTDYNESIAGFVLTLMPDDLPADQLAGALVVTRTASSSPSGRGSR